MVTLVNIKANLVGAYNKNIEFKFTKIPLQNFPNFKLYLFLNLCHLVFTSESEFEKSPRKKVENSSTL